MKLEMKSFSVRDIQFADETKFDNGVLSINKEEVRSVAMESGAFADVVVELVRPQESTRVIHVMDIAEARYKTGAGSTFPGFVDPVKTVGQGTTHRLDGMTVISAGDAVAGEPTYWREALVDMTGPGAEASPFGATLNLVLHFFPSPDYLRTELPDAKAENIMIGSLFAQRYNGHVRVAELRVAAHLGKTTKEASPDSVDVFDLPPHRPNSLPGVVYLWQGSPSLYGHTFEDTLPTVIHPNEVLDGAVINTRTNSHASQRDSTFFNLNHAMIRELYRRHGKDWDFTGVVLYPGASDDLEAKELVTEYVVKLARMLGADSVISTYLGGGHPCVDFMMICQKCESQGIKTVLVMPEAYGTPEDPGFVHSVPEAVAITSTGRGTQPVNLPAVEKVIGGDSLFDLDMDPKGELTIPYRYVYGCTTNTGYGRLTAKEY